MEQIQLQRVRVRDERMNESAIESESVLLQPCVCVCADECDSECKTVCVRV